MVYDRVVLFRHICLCIYVDDPRQTLNRCRTGCLPGNITVNHLMYADGLVLLSPSAKGLRGSTGLRSVEAPGQQCYRKVVDVMSFNSKCQGM